MRAYEIQGSFGLENLRRVDRPVPEPGPGQVRVRVRAVSLNYRDVLTVRGFYNPRQPLPLVPCSDGVGVIEAVGPGVTRVAVGDRVAGIFAQDWHSGEPSRDKLRTTLGGPLDGTLSEQIVLSAEGVVGVPDHLSDEEAATLPCAAVTAWSSLVTMGGIKAGDTVLVLGTGGVSIFALQFARLAGARVIVTSSSDEKLERARALGADETVNYRKHPEWWREVRKWTEDRGVDHVIEVGGAGTFEQSVRSVRIGGHIGLIGVLAGGQQEINLTRVLMQNIRVQGVIVGHRESFEAMNRAISSSGMRPVVDQVFAFEDAIAAFEALGAAKHFGKICVRVSA